MWRKNELVDCIDPHKKWLGAKVVETRPSKQEEKNHGEDVKVAYLDFSSKYDEWISIKDQGMRLRKQFRGSHLDNPVLKLMGPQSFDNLIITNRIDVYDASKSIWREAQVIDIHDEAWLSEKIGAAAYKSVLDGAQMMPPVKGQIARIKIHYSKMSKRYDEVIERSQFDERIASVQLHYAKTKREKPAEAM